MGLLSRTWGQFEQLHKRNDLSKKVSALRYWSSTGSSKIAIKWRVKSEWSTSWTDMHCSMLLGWCVKSVPCKLFGEKFTHSTCHLHLYSGAGWRRQVKREKGCRQTPTPPTKLFKFYVAWSLVLWCETISTISFSNQFRDEERSLAAHQTAKWLLILIRVSAETMLEQHLQNWLDAFVLGK